ncbi:MAG: alanine/glycine:cation symporter family protein [Flavobacteriaceae bacterium]|nr:alanine/glycine:cation symporter family protein [Flavobacteriaceae bacterium]MCY4216758.1 alanine/glycine:cation symporter family protein [Flavobacteriaceae bacterium]MCY4266939.1 alanine/glycine:cation symporter family protein [Flavobacteriaceae bacterium]MCY4298746.1 alanine/glycine:cation symporter family protein [Flavobacteriaceae bacterium]
MKSIYFKKISIAWILLHGTVLFSQDVNQSNQPISDDTIVVSEDHIDVTQNDIDENAPPSEPISEETRLGLDDRIDQGFGPIASVWESIVFFQVPLSKKHSIPFVVILLAVGALFFTIVFKFPNVTKFKLAIDTVRGKYDNLKDKKSKDGEVSHFQALTTAVSGTVGLGNIAGVAVAIALGGPGATFWMIVCGLFGMSTKFVECTLGVKYRDVDHNGVVHGGPMYYLSRGLKEMGFGMGVVGKILAGLFAVFCVGGALGGGNMFQSNQATDQITTLLNLEGGASGFVTGLIFAFLVGIVIIGGIKRIANFTSRIVPIMAGIYIVATLIILAVNIRYIDDAFVLIFNSAFTPMAGLGGFIGVLIVGFRRAAFSNEAGAGSAAIAHSAVKTKHPASEGIVALLEPFIDTVIICTMTALVIIFFNFSDGNFQSQFTYGNVESSGVVLNETGEQLGGVDLTSRAFDSVLPGFSYILTIAVILFAFSTMISWSYYGIQSWKYLFGRSQLSDLSFKILFLFFVVVGASITLDSVVRFADAMILALVFPNMIGLFILFPRVRRELNSYLKAIVGSKFK